MQTYEVQQRGHTFCYSSTDLVKVVDKLDHFISQGTRYAAVVSCTRLFRPGGLDIRYLDCQANQKAFQYI